ADTTTSVAGADIAMSMHLSIPGAAAPVTMSGAGYESFRSRQAQLSFRIAGLPTTGGGPSSLTFDMRMLYPTMFMRTPLLTGKLPAGKQWIKLDFATAVRQAGIDPTLLSSQQSDPSEYLSYLRAASGKVQNLGHEQIRGVSTTHYRATC